MTDNRPILQEALAAARFEAIFRSCYPRVLAYVLRRTEGREVAEEVVSETFLIAWRRLEALPLEPLPWLLGTARKVLGHRRRSERRLAAHLTVSSLEGVEIADPETPFAERLARRESLAAAFAALPDRESRDPRAGRVGGARTAGGGTGSRLLGGHLLATTAPRPTTTLERACSQRAFIR